MSDDLTNALETIAGMRGALTLLYPPNSGPHTLEAFRAHSDRYNGGMEAYRIGADEVARAAEAHRRRYEPIDT
jgi:hypothetical protein